MISDPVMRGALWTTAALNGIVAIAIAVPGSSLGTWAGLPVDPPLVYRLMLGWTIALFGVGYGWLATQPTMLRPLVVGACAGKAGAFAIVLVAWLGAAASGRLLLLASGDLGFAAVFFGWLRAARPAAPPV